MIRIETERLILRTPAETDLDAYLAYRNEPAALLAQHLEPADRQEARAFLLAQEELPENAIGWRMLGIEQKHRSDAEGRIVGEVGVFLEANKPDEGNVGWWLHSEARGRGLATEAAFALLGWCFDVRRLHRVTSACLADNAGSLRIMQRLGMRIESRMQESRKLGDEWHDEIACAMLSREWNERRDCGRSLAEFRSPN